MRRGAGVAARVVFGVVAVAATASGGCASILGIDEAKLDDALGCPPVPAASISDFDTGEWAIVKQTGQADWYVFWDNVGGYLEPLPMAEGVRVIQAEEDSPCSGRGMLRLAGTEIAGAGAGLGAPLALPDGAGKHGYFNASAYAGVYAWMRCDYETKNVHFFVQDASTDFDAPSPACPGYDACSGHGIWKQTVGTKWQRLDIDFASAEQAAHTAAAYRSTLDKTRLTAITIKFDANYDAVGTPSPSDFDCIIDDVHFHY
jgi:hypothetical protein